MNRVETAVLLATLTARASRRGWRGGWPWSARGWSPPGERRVGRLRSVAGLALVALGAAGTLVPVVPGVPLLLAGLAVLGSDHPISRAIARRLRRRRPPHGKEPS